MTSPRTGNDLAGGGDIKRNSNALVYLIVDLMIPRGDDGPVYV